VHPIEIFQSTLLKLVEVLERFRIRYHLTGGITAVAYGEPRMTQDLDLVLAWRAVREHRDAFLDALTASGFLVELPSARQAVDEKRMFQILDLEQALKLDLYPEASIPGELDRSVLAEVLPGIRLPIASRGDAALSKLIWIREGSHKSRDDLRQILRRASSDEVARVRQSAARMDLLDLLDRIVAETDAESGWSA
jgi:hypothetical protein